MFGFDLDGVVIDSYTYFIQGINKAFNQTFCPKTNPMPYTPSDHGYSITHAEFIQVFDTMVNAEVFPPMEGAIAGLKAYYEKTNRLVFITHRNGKLVVDKTRKFLSENLELPYELYACYKCEKVDLAKDLGLTGFVDDHPEIIAKFIEANMTAYLFDAPWHSFGFETEGMNLITSWEDLSLKLL